MGFLVDIGLAEEIERAVAGASIDSRLHAFKKLRARVREQAEPDAADWLLSQSTEVIKINSLFQNHNCYICTVHFFLRMVFPKVNNTMISVYQRKRPRGDWMNIKMTGMVGESPVGFVKGE